MSGVNAVSIASSVALAGGGTSGRIESCGPKATVGAPVSAASHAASGEWSAWQWVTRMWVTSSPSRARAQRFAVRGELRARDR